jgi:hypothetical protein
MRQNQVDAQMNNAKVRVPQGPKGPKAMLALVEKWKDIPEGTPVIVTKDFGEQFHTKTRSAPWLLGSSSRDPGHTAVIMVEGISGGYGLWRVRLDSVERTK